MAAPAPASAFLSAPANGGIEIITTSSRNKKKSSEALFVCVLTRSSRSPVCISVSLSTIQAGRPLSFHSYTRKTRTKKKKRTENHTKIPGSMQCNINTFEMKTIPFYYCYVYSTAKDFRFLLQIKYVFKEIHSDF